MKRPLDLTALMLFHEIVKCGNLAGASAKLGIAKSTVSRRLAGLERQIGSILIKRGTRKLSLTEIGTNLYDHAQRIAAEVEQASEQAMETQSDMLGTLRLSIPGDLGVSWLGGIIADFHRDFPRVAIHVRINSSDIIDPVEEPYDIVIQVGEKRPMRPVCRRLATFSRGIYVSPAYLAARGAPHSMEECQQHDWILAEVQERDGIWLFRNKSRTRRSANVTSRIVANSARLARELAISGLGLALLPDVLCRDAVRDGHLVRVLPDWRAPALEVVALIISRNRIPRKTRVFVEYIADKLSTSRRSPAASRTKVGA